MEWYNKDIVFSIIFGSNPEAIPHKLLLKMAEKLPCHFRIRAFLKGIPKLQDAGMRKGPIIRPTEMNY